VYQQLADAPPADNEYAHIAQRRPRSAHKLADRALGGYGGVFDGELRAAHVVAAALTALGCRGLYLCAYLAADHNSTAACAVEYVLYAAWLRAERSIQKPVRIFGRHRQYDGIGLLRRGNGANAVRQLRFVHTKAQYLVPVVFEHSGK